MSTQHANEARPAVERIAAFVNKARAADLDTEIRRTIKRNVLDSLGCAISALPGRPFEVLREQFAEYRTAGTCTLIGGGTTAPDQAALFNSGLVRYVDLLDSYMSPGGLCHPSDNFGAVLAAAEHADANGEQFLLALAIAYEVQCRITAVVPVMAKGFNHAVQLAISVGLTEGQISDAISIATVDNISLSCIHSEPVSQWKGFSPGITGMRALYVASLAKRGFTGPSRIFEGPNGLDRMFNQAIPVDWEDPSLAVVKQTVLKKFCCLIHGKPVLEATLDLKRKCRLAPGDIDSVTCDIFQSGYDIAGGGTFGSKDRPQTKEQADYNLKYLIAAALLDSQVGPAQLEPQRIQAADAQALLARVIVRPDDTFSARYPQDLGARITIHTRDGRKLVQEKLGYEGSLANPMSWDRVVEKFHWLSEAHADGELRERIIRVVQELDSRPLSDLMELLAAVKRMTTYPTNHHGIQ